MQANKQASSTKLMTSDRHDMGDVRLLIWYIPALRIRNRIHLDPLHLTGSGSGSTISKGGFEDPNVALRIRNHVKMRWIRDAGIYGQIYISLFSATFHVIKEFVPYEIKWTKVPNC